MVSSLMRIICPLSMTQSIMKHNKATKQQQHAKWPLAGTIQNNNIQSITYLPKYQDLAEKRLNSPRMHREIGSGDQQPTIQTPYWLINRPFSAKLEEKHHQCPQSVITHLQTLLCCCCNF